MYTAHFAPSKKFRKALLDYCVEREYEETLNVLSKWDQMVEIAFHNHEYGKLLYSYLTDAKCKTLTLIDLYKKVNTSGVIPQSDNSFLHIDSAWLRYNKSK